MQGQICGVLFPYLQSIRDKVFAFIAPSTFREQIIKERKLYLASEHILRPIEKWRNERLDSYKLGDIFHH